MTDIQRYEIEMDYEDGYDTYWQSVPCDSGEWVKWDEVQALLAERDALRADAERWRWYFRIRPLGMEATPTEVTFLDGFVHDWSLDQWREAFDKAMAEHSALTPNEKQP